MNKLINYLWLAASIACVVPLNGQTWRTLFDGSSLDGWEQHGGTATYEIEDGVLIGTSVSTPINSFLCTKEKFRDFILELEMLLPSNLNSGIMFRSDIRKEGDRVFGYQCEVDPSYRRFSGGIYDEARRLWMYPISRNEPAYDAFRLGHWNTIRIECLGQELRTYINGKMCANMLDDETASGIFGLQVHGVYREEDVGLSVMWRNIKILTENIDAHRLPIDYTVPELNYVNQYLTDREQRMGVRMLQLSATGASDPCTSANGLITCQNEAAMSYQGGLSNFELSFEFQTDKSSDAGVMYRLPLLNRMMEFQITDDDTSEDAKMGKNGNRGVASLYDVIPADNLTTPGRGKQYKGSSHWNHGRIVVNHHTVEHWLNHEKAVAYNMDDQAFKALLNYAEKVERDSKNTLSFISQKGNVKFKNVKIREW